VDIGRVGVLEGTVDPKPKTKVFLKKQFGITVPLHDATDILSRELITVPCEGLSEAVQLWECRMTHDAAETETAGKTGIGLRGMEIGEEEECQNRAEDEKAMRRQKNLRMNIKTPGDRASGLC
jgi:hypothetical protein